MSTIREQLAWAAGVFDGEGNVSARAKGSRRYITAQVAQAHPELLERFAAAVYVGGIRGPYQPRGAKGKPYWIWSANSHEAVQQVGAALWPWLGSVKREQFRSGLLAYRAGIPEPVLCEPHGVLKRTCTPCLSEQTRLSWGKRERSPHVERDRAIYAAFLASKDRRGVAAEFGVGYSRVCQIITRQAKEQSQ